MARNAEIPSNDTTSPTGQHTRFDRRTSFILGEDDLLERFAIVEKEKFMAAASTNLEHLHARIVEMANQYCDEMDMKEDMIDRPHGKVGKKDEQLLTLQSTMQELLDSKTILQEGRQRYKNKIAELIMDSSSAANQTQTIREDTTAELISPFPTPKFAPGLHMPTRESTLGLGVRKSTKLPDASVLIDGKERRFEDWLLDIRAKLEGNADHYDTLRMRIAYVNSRCGGQARKHITPRMRADSTNPYRDSETLLRHLETIYHDANRVHNAKNQFPALRMKFGQNFHDFLSEFLYLAAEGNVAEEGWKDDLYHRLTPKLQELTIGTFQEFSQKCAQTASRLEIINPVVPERATPTREVATE